MNNPDLLIVTAVEIERDAVSRGLADASEIATVIAAGVGPAAAAAATAKELAQHPYRYVVSAGIAGGFQGKAKIGSLAVATEIIGADLGVETADGFAYVDELGFGSSRMKVAPKPIHNLLAKLKQANVPYSFFAGAILTVSTATGTEDTAKLHLKREPAAVAEAMEGFGVATAASYFAIPAFEIRAISNLVGPRDRAAWRIDQALETLGSACSFLPEVLT